MPAASSPTRSRSAVHVIMEAWRMDGGGRGEEGGGRRRRMRHDLLEAWRRDGGVAYRHKVSVRACDFSPALPRGMRRRDASLDARRVPSMMRERERREREGGREGGRETTVHGLSFLKYSHAHLKYVCFIKSRLFTKQSDVARASALASRTDLPTSPHATCNLLKPERGSFDGLSITCRLCGVLIVSPRLVSLSVRPTNTRLVPPTLGMCWRERLRARELTRNDSP